MSAQLSVDSWHHRGACRGPQLAVFFPPAQFERKAERAEREQRAKAICATCPVREECLEFALSSREPHGIWGGMNENERRLVIEGAPV